MKVYICVIPCHLASSEIGHRLGASYRIRVYPTEEAANKYREHCLTECFILEKEVIGVDNRGIFK